MDAFSEELPFGDVFEVSSIVSDIFFSILDLSLVFGDSVSLGMLTSRKKNTSSKTCATPRESKFLK